LNVLIHDSVISDLLSADNQIFHIKYSFCRPIFLPFDFAAWGGRTPPPPALASQNPFSLTLFYYRHGKRAIRNAYKIMDEEDEGNRAHGRRRSKHELEDNIKVHVK
jgi:hypothetical protein